MIAHRSMLERPLVAHDEIYLPAEDRQEIVSCVRDKGCEIRTSKMPEREGNTWFTVCATCLWRGLDRGWREVKIFLRKSKARDMNELQSWQKFAPLRISSVNMSEGLHLPEMRETTIVPSATHLQVAVSLCSM